MTKGSVVRPGHVALRVLDLDDALNHYKNVIGLIETGRDDKDRVYLKAWDEFDHHSVVLREADSPGLDYVGFRVSDLDSMESYGARLRSAGIGTDMIPRGEHLSCGERLRFQIPSGHFIELFAEKDKVGNGMPTINPPPWPDGLIGMAPTRFDHVLLYGNHFDETVSLFIDVLDFELTEQVMDGSTRMAAFLTCSNKAHDIAIIRHEEAGKLHHVSFNLDSWSDLLRAGDIIGKTKTSLDVGPTRHGLTRGQTIYFYDPSGNRNEVFAGGYTWYSDKPVITWMMEDIAQAIFYHEQKIKPAYLSAYT